MKGQSIMPRLPIDTGVIVIVASALMAVGAPAWAAPEDVAAGAIEDYLEFVEYGGATIFSGAPERAIAPSGPLSPPTIFRGGPS